MSAEPHPPFQFDTLAVHGGGSDATFRGAHPTAVPIVTASSFWYDAADDLDRVLGGEQPGYVYGRYASPTVEAFELALAQLEQAEGAVAFASGMAALHATLMACAPHPGDVVLASQDLYGGTSTLLTDVLMQQGVQVRFVDVFDLPRLAEMVEAAQPRALLLEIVSNPLVRVADLPAIVEIASRQRTAVVVDATFTTPYLLQPIGVGAAYVVHSATKYLGGHGDVTAGVVAVNTPERAAELRTLCKLAGAVLGPMEAYLALRGLQTLAIRMQRQCENAAAVATALAAHPRVERVYYPGLPSSPDFALAHRLFRGGAGGAVLAFAIRDAGRDEVMRVMERLRLIRPAPTLGDCRSLVLYPAIASHRGLTPEQRRARGIHDNVLRLSVGIEDPTDLVVDLDQAISAP